MGLHEGTVYITTSPKDPLEIQIFVNCGIRFDAALSKWPSCLLQNCGYNEKRYGFEVIEQARNPKDLFGIILGS